MKFVLRSLCVAVVVASLGSLAQAADKPARFARFEVGGKAVYGVLEGEQLRQIEGDLFGEWKKTDKTFPAGSVKFLPPTNPTQVLALAGNYKSHLKDAVIPEKYQIVQPFFKTPACLVGHGDNIVIPKGAENVHYEAELVIVMGKKAQNVSEADAGQYIFGITCGNDVSARDWQKNDIQWWRAKASDTFGPCGPYIATGVDYNNLLLKLRLNGEVKQEQRTSELIHSIHKTVSVISHHITLQPGDLIFTGTPGTTSEIKPGDTVEVELEHVGTLTNKVVAKK